MLELTLWLAGVVLCTLAAFVAVFFKMMTAGRVQAVDSEWLGGFSVARYRPMARLLSEDDLRFLASQRGFEPGLGRKLRADRRRIFRMYLRNLSRDFQRLHLAAKLMVLYSPQDRPELAGLLMRQRLVFARAMLAVNARLLLHATGIGVMDVRGLLEALEGMRLRVQDLAIPLPQGASA